jgi:peptide/nickel transport system substrate-binding protein
VSYGKVTKLTLLFLIAILFALPSAGCRREEAVPSEAPIPPGMEQPVGEPVDGDWIVRRLEAGPKTLNPFTARDEYQFIVNEYVYESLLDRDKKTLEVVPKLAESYTISGDHLEYTFKLRRDVKFHDGTPMTARDVQFCFERIKDPKVDAAHLRNYHRDVESIEVIDDYTVRFKCKEPYWLALEFVGGFAIMPRQVFEKGDFNNHPNNRHPIGTGPYKFVKWETGREIVLERNDNYWAEKGYPDRIIFKIVVDDTVALQLFKRGDLDVCERLSPEQWIRQTQGAEFERKAYKLAYDHFGYYYIGWNMRRPFFSDKRVRRAMTHLIDREGIVTSLIHGLGTIVTGNFYVNGPVYDHSIEPWAHDPAEAERLINEAGWVDHDGDGIRDKNGVKFSFEFLISSGSSYAEQLGTILQEDLKKVGIEMSIRRLEWATFAEQVHDRKFEATTMGWGMDIEGDPFQVWHSSQADKGSNYVGFINAEADEIIEKGRREFDKEKRRAMYRQLHAILHEEQPYTFFYCPQDLTVIDRRFQNVRAHNHRLALEPKEWYVPKARQKYGQESDAS